jgi:hypothetical protein
MQAAVAECGVDVDEGVGGATSRSSSDEDAFRSAEQDYGSFHRQGGGRSKHPAQAREGGSGALFQFQEQLCACTPMPAQISTAIHVDQAD